MSTENLNNIYRFRPIDKILSTEQLDTKDATGNFVQGYGELEKQQIYFSPLHQLNDPMEGHKDLYWKGDEIVWKNFLRHYLMCLEHTFSLYLIGGEKFNLSAENIPVFKKYSDFSTAEYTQNFTEICNLFFESDYIKNSIKFFASRENPPIRKNEILLYLDSLHLYALQCILEASHKKGLMRNNVSFAGFDLSKTILTEEYFSALDKLKEEYPEKPETIETLAMITLQAKSQLKLISKLSNEDISSNKRFFIEGFPQAYIKQIEQLLYPDSYISCFSSSYENASMWSHYAGNHEGVCFQFKLETHDKFPLNGIVGAAASKDHIRDIMGKINFEIHKVEYETKFPEIDFFRFIGVLPLPHLFEVWAMNESKIKSSVYEHIGTPQEPSWRKEFWGLCTNILKIKTKDWAYEEELRLTMTSSMIDSQKNSKSISYDFDSLDGIIFGINTQEKHKEQIIKIIEAKCKESKRKDFKFYQAYYCPQSGRIAKQELSLLSFK